MAFLSCQQLPLSELSRADPPTQNAQTVRDSTALVEEKDTVPDLYASAICYPDGVNWQADSCAGAQLVLFKNAEELLRIPVPGKPEAERHRIVRGQLWSDCCDGYEVVVSCNGQEQFRYEGDELFRGFLVVGPQVFTLGQRQGRDGFSFRANGALRFEAPSGTILGGPEDSEWEGGAFCYDSAGLFYAYAIPIHKEDGLVWEYRLMKEDQLYRQIPAGSIGKLYDLRVLDGAVYRSEYRSSLHGSFCLVKEETYHSLDFSGETHLCKLVPGQEGLLLKGYSEGMPGGKQYAFWLRDAAQFHCMITDNLYIRDLLWDGTHNAYLTEGPSGTVRSLFLDKQQVIFTSDCYTLPSTRCFQLRKGVLGAALSCPGKGEHLLVRDHTVTRLSFNGYFTSVQID